MWKGEKKRPWKPRAQRESCLGLQAWRVGHTLSPAPASEFRPKSCLDIPQAPPTPWVPYSGAGSTFGPQPCHEPALVPGDAPPSPLAALYLILPLLSMSSATTLAHTLVRLLASGPPLLTLFHPPGAGVTFLKGPSSSLLPPLALLSIHQGYGLPLGVTLATWQNTPL